MVKLKIFFITILLLVMFIFACGESDSGGSNTNEDGIVTSRIINNDMVHTIADFETAGLKFFSLYKFYSFFIWPPFQLCPLVLI